MRTTRALFTFIATLFLTAGLTLPVANAQPVVNQGDRIRIDGIGGWSECTVGYVDHARNRLITSSHCIMVPGQPVRNAHGHRIGTVVSPPMHAFFAQNDYAYISLRGARPGKNGFSGPAIVNPSHIRPGEKVCQYGASTRTQRCGTVHVVRGSAIVIDGIHGTRRGDSGGPTWIPGRGFVGAYTGRSGSFAAASAPFFYVGPDLLWSFLSDVRQPVTSSNLPGIHITIT